MNKVYDERAKILLGFAVGLLVALSETLVAHSQLPNPASPYVWTCLGVGAASCLAGALWFRHKSKEPQA